MPNGRDRLRHHLPEAAAAGVGEAVERARRPRRAGEQRRHRRARVGGRAPGRARPHDRRGEPLRRLERRPPRPSTQLVASRGRVVFVASRMAFLGLPLGAAYAVSKRGLTAYADCVRAEYGTHVTVSSHPPRDGAHADPRQPPPPPAYHSTACPARSRSRAWWTRIVAGLPGPAAPRATPRSRARGGRSCSRRATCPGWSTAWWPARWPSASASGAFDDAPLAAGLRERHGRA